MYARVSQSNDGAAAKRRHMRLHVGIKIYCNEAMQLKIWRCDRDHETK